uniref:Uncharacterized protein n=1 Tax=Glossina austeni TaxID=7395 RepID=A0A1A9VQ58_GLOAU
MWFHQDLLTISRSIKYNVRPLSLKSQLSNQSLKPSKLKVLLKFGGMFVRSLTVTKSGTFRALFEDEYNCIKCYKNEDLPLHLTVNDVPKPWKLFIENLQSLPTNMKMLCLKTEIAETVVGIEPAANEDEGPRTEVAETVVGIEPAANEDEGPRTEVAETAVGIEPAANEDEGPRTETRFPMPGYIDTEHGGSQARFPYYDPETLKIWDFRAKQ